MEEDYFPVSRKAKVSVILITIFTFLIPFMIGILIFPEPELGARAGQASLCGMFALPIAILVDIEIIFASAKKIRRLKNKTM